MNLLLLEHEGVTEVTGFRAEHIFCVLKAREGDELRAGLLGGGIGRAKVKKASRTSVTVECNDFPEAPPAKNKLIPVIALPRPQSFKKTLHFIASSGIGKAYFIGTKKVEKSYWKSGAADADSIREELVLGLEQGVDTVLPELVFEPDFLKFEHEILPNVEGERKLVAHPVNARKCPAASDATTVLAIGPEGGFIPREVEAFENAGFTAVTSGANILRVEFALSFFAGRLVNI